tara:strand:- start:953 stop:1408 length:456 start_codon:yes stop_codon:yes gene_type:complete
MATTAPPKEKEVEINKEDDDTPEYQEMIMFYISNIIRASLTLWCLAIISLAYIKLPPKMFGMEIPEQRIDATYSAGLLGNLLASYGISIGGMGKKKKRENGEGQNGSGSSNNRAETVIRLLHDVELKVDKPKIDKITNKPIDPVTGRLETT